MCGKGRQCSGFTVQYDAESQIRLDSDHRESGVEKSSGSQHPVMRVKIFEAVFTAITS